MRPTLDASPLSHSLPRVQPTLIDASAAPVSSVSTASPATLSLTKPSVLFVDQSVERALAWSDRLYAMDNGRIVLTGRSDDVPASTLIDIIVGAEIAGRDASVVAQPG